MIHSEIDRISIVVIMDATCAIMFIMNIAPF